MADENIFNKIEELFGKKPKNFSILEDQIDIKTQLSYFEESKKVKESGIIKKDLLEKKDYLYDPKLSNEEKKGLLVSFASIDDVEAYRIIERFLSNPEPELKNWAVLALQESRMTIESSLLNENQVIISTGLGGKGKKLRYFVVLSSEDNIEFSDLQKRLIHKELEFALKKVDGEIEKNEFVENYTTLLAIVPITVSIKAVIQSAVNECNQIGNFISSKFILTNVKVFTIDEIKKSWPHISD
ncbi:MAG: hypothetical protein ABFS35_09815 [Bacteroidota bacterium]